MKKLLSLVMAGAMVASLVPATAFAKGDVSATVRVIDAIKLTKDEAKNHPQITEGNYANEVPEVQMKITGVDYRVTDPGSATLEVTLTLDNAEFISTTDAALEALVSARRDGTNLMTLTGSTWHLDDEGTLMSTAAEGDKEADVDDDDVKAIPAAEAAVDDYALATVKLADVYGEAITVSGTTAADVVLTKTGEADIVVVDQSVADNAFAAGQNSATVITALKNGYALTDADKVLKIDNLDGDSISVVSARVPAITVDEVITRDHAGFIRGNFVGGVSDISVAVKEKDDDTVTYKFTGKFEKDDIISFDLSSKLTKTSEGTTATVAIESKAVTTDALTYATVLGQGLTVSVKKLVDVAEDEKVTLNSNGLKIKAAVGEFASGANATEITLKLSNGFEFVKNNMGTADYADVAWVDDNEIKLTVNTALKDEITLKGTQIEATSAKSGAIATITAKSPNVDSGSCEVAKVCDYKVNLTVDEDEDVPVIYSGTNVANKGLTDDSDHMSLEVTAEETFPGAWSMRQGFNFNLPDGVYVTKVDVTDTENFVYTVNNVKNDVDDTKWEEAFFDAYQNGDHKNFEFKKRVFDDVNQELETKPAKVTFQLQLVADPTFEGDVVVTFEGSLVDTQSVTIAKFVKPYTVKAEQNDVIIDYRNTAINTAITITEAAEGLLKENTEFTLLIEDNLIDFDGDPKVAADDASEMTIKDDDTTNGTFVFEIDDESDSAATITISDMELFMNRSIPAGGYDLKISTTMSKAYDAQVLFAPDNATTYAGMAAAVTAANAAWVANARTSANTTVKDTYIDDVTDYSSTVKEAFINVVTSGRDQDNLFTTKVVVPVGEGYLVAGETKVTLDAPAYISAAGYTMLPVRAVSRALGVDTNNVLWSAETKTVTIMFAQRIISMTVGQKTIYVNGSAIPSSAAPEIKDGRTFLPLRDLGTALGVTNVSWDSATKTATLN